MPRRAAADSTVLLLDEPSAALDPESEQLIFQGLSRLMAGWTSITVAHPGVQWSIERTPTPPAARAPTSLAA